MLSNGKRVKDKTKQNLSSTKCGCFQWLGAPLKLSLSAVASGTKSHTIQNMFDPHVVIIHVNLAFQVFQTKDYQGIHPPRTPGATPWGVSWYWKHVTYHISISTINLPSSFSRKHIRHIPPNGIFVRRKIIDSKVPNTRESVSSEEGTHQKQIVTGDTPCLASTFSRPWAWHIKTHLIWLTLNHAPLHPEISHEISCEDHIMTSIKNNMSTHKVVQQINQNVGCLFNHSESKWRFLALFFGGGERETSLRSLPSLQQNLSPPPLGS